MANSITGQYTFTAGERIRSAYVNSNFSNLRTMSSLWQKYTVSYSSYVALGASITSYVPLFTLDATEVVTGFYVKHSTAFTGGAISAAKVKVGPASSSDKYVDEFDVFAAASSSNFTLVNSLGIENSSTSIVLTLSLTGGNLNALAAGSIDVYVQKSTLPS